MRKIANYLLSPDKGLSWTWVILFFAGSLIFHSRIWFAMVLAGPTFILLLMLGVAAYLPPTKPLREFSVLAARVADLGKVISSAALFGAAAAYGGAIGTFMSKMPIEEVMAPTTMWGTVWPILMVAVMFGSVVVGVRLGWDFRRSSRRSILVALGRLRSRIFSPASRQHPIFNWVASLVITASRSGLLMFIGYLSPIIIFIDIQLALDYIRAVA